MHQPQEQKDKFGSIMLKQLLIQNTCLKCEKARKKIFRTLESGKGIWSTYLKTSCNDNKRTNILTITYHLNNLPYTEPKEDTGKAKKHVKSALYP